jgi:hypothetical protein
MHKPNRAFFFFFFLLRSLRLRRKTGRIQFYKPHMGRMRSEYEISQQDKMKSESRSYRVPSLNTPWVI